MLFMLSWVELRRVELNKTPSQSYRVSLSIWDHTVLSAIRHKWTHPALIPARQAGMRFIYPAGTEGWVDLSRSSAGLTSARSYAVISSLSENHARPQSLYNHALYACSCAMCTVYVCISSAYMAWYVSVYRARCCESSASSRHRPAVSRQC